ncbi:hypothetical protein M405DRAFT_834410, partial [Rhizopogon salebrosus TDB-379]
REIVLKCGLMLPNPISSPLRHPRCAKGLRSLRDRQGFADDRVCVRVSLIYL